MLRAARNVDLVVKDGQVYDPTKLLDSVAGKIGPSGRGDHDDWTLRVKALR